MKILISSKTLAEELKKIDFESETVMQVRGEGSKFIINTNKKTIEIWCDIIFFEPIVKQENRRWDWVKHLLSQVEEQPIVLNIQQDFINIIFQY